MVRFTGFVMCAYYLLCSFYANSQCQTSVSFQNTKNLPASIPTIQHHMSARRDSSALRPYLYIAAKESGFICYNISNLTAPLQVASIPSSSLAGLDVNSITQAGNYLYLALGDIFSATSQKSGMAIIDVSSPSSPLIKSVFTFSANSGAGAVAIDGNYAYLAAMQNGVIVLDISNKSNIQFVSRIRPNINFPVNNPTSSDQLKINARSLVVKNNILYLCYDAGGIRILNTTNKTNLTETGRYSNSLLNNRARAYNNMVLNDSLLYVAADYCGMEILKIKDTANISRVGWWNPWKCETTANNWLNSPGHTNEIEYDPGCKLVFMSAGRSDLMAVNVSNPFSPDSCSQFGLKTDSIGSWGLGRYGNQIYLAYISTWPLYIPFRSEWSGIKIITYNNNCSTGLSAYSNSPELSVFPNPSNSFLNISGNLEEGTEVAIYALDGRTVWQQKIRALQSKLEIDIRSFARGLYYLQINTTKQILNKPLMLSD